jgi:hypothetical protein
MGIGFLFFEIIINVPAVPSQRAVVVEHQHQFFGPSFGRHGPFVLLRLTLLISLITITAFPMLSTGNRFDGGLGGGG